MTDIQYKKLVIDRPSECRYRRPYEGCRTLRCFYDYDHAKDCDSPFTFPKHCPLEDSEVLHEKR